MTPKEKAKELVEKFKSYCDVDDPNGVLNWEGCLKYNAKKRALIAVEEILNIDNVKPYILHKEIINYYTKVKKEIEKL